MKKPTNYIHPKLERLDTVQDEEGNPMQNAFSSMRCDCCNALPGERYTVKAVYWNKRARISSSTVRGTFQVCPDCIYLWQ
jgi:hypothetical protein